MSCSVRDKVVPIDHETATIPHHLPAPLPQITYRALSGTDRGRIRIVVDLAGKVDVEIPADLRIPAVESAVKFAALYLEGYARVLLDKWDEQGSE